MKTVKEYFKKINFSDVLRICLVIGGVALGICGVSNWGWLIFLSLFEW